MQRTRALTSSIAVLTAAGLLLLTGMTSIRGTSDAWASTSVGWSTPVAVTGANDSNKQIAVDSEGTVHAVWNQSSEFSREVYYACKPKDGPWSSPENIYTSPQEIGDAHIAVDGSGRVHVMWGRQFDVDDVRFVHLTRDPDGEWLAEPQVLFPSDHSAPLHVIAREEILHLFYLDSVSCAADEVYYSAKTAGGDWSSPVNVSDMSRRVTDFSAARDGSGMLHLTFNVTGGGYLYDSIMYASLPVGGTWSAPAEIDRRAAIYCKAPSIALDHNDSLHLVWGDSVSPDTYGALHMEKPQAGGWSTQDVLPFATTTYPTDVCPALAVGGENTLYAVHYQSGGLHYTGKESGGPWSSPALVPGPEGGRPRMAADTEGRLHLLWSNPDGVWYSRGAAVLPTPTPTPEPASAVIPTDGGSLSHHYPGHTTTLEVPAGAISAPSTFTISYRLPPTTTGQLQGMDHFFTLDGEQTAFTTPFTLTASYSESVRGPIVPGTEAIYSWQGSQWVTDDITLNNRWPTGLSVQINHLSLFGVLGETNRVYLPVVLKD